VADGAPRRVTSTRRGGITRLVLSDPASRNSLSEAMLGELERALAEAAADPAVRAVVIAARGPVFSSGHDPKELTAHRADPDRGRAYFQAIFARCSALMRSIAEHEKPIIAEVAGVASAAGCQLVASCDLAVAAAGARFQTPGVQIGFFCSTPMVALARSVVRKHAFEMLLTGDMISARRAARMGLVNCVVPARRLQRETLALASRSRRSHRWPWPPGSVSSSARSSCRSRPPTGSRARPWRKMRSTPTRRRASTRS
jgi:enoyl-CoA hydratase/carnithine racemase